MGRRGRVRLRSLREALLRAHPEIVDADAVIARGAVTVDGRISTNPSTLVPVTAHVALYVPRALRGEQKLGPVLDAGELRVVDRIALDAGAAAGGFTQALLARGARRVYAIDVGHGQLLGSLRQDPRVVALERTNIGAVDIPERIGLVTLDLSYLALSDAVPQLERLAFEVDAGLVALVKPQFELGLAAPPTEPALLRRAVDRARDAIAAGPWRVVAVHDSPLRGTGGAIESFVVAERQPIR
jgi:23S rRNA (cytidine1920-2'-O)/16S rRNA (cytidine1409-2'-O)-methyltransferase